jgi:hypothetical protein
VTHSSAHSSVNQYTTSTSGTIGESEECQGQKYALQAVYIKAYIEITRLVAYYQWEITAHTCEDYVYEEEHTKEKMYEETLVKATTTVHSYTHKLSLPTQNPGSHPRGGDPAYPHSGALPALPRDGRDCV